MVGAPALSDALDRLLHPYSGAVPGAAVVVVRDGRVVHEQVRGLARLPDGPAVTPGTNFRLASISKQFTGKAIALLVDDGRLSLDTSLRGILTGLPEWGDVVRIGHVVAHTAGLPHYEDLLPPDATAQVSDRDVVRMMEAVPALDFEPGTRFEYSNTGYVLLGVVLEEVAGRTYGELLAERIFRPLGMEGTVAHVEGRTEVRERAWGYAPPGPVAGADSVAGSRAASGSPGPVTDPGPGASAGAGYTAADRGATTATLGDGGIYSSIRDLARWEAALREPGYRPDPADLRRFAARPRNADGYGWGWFLDRFRGRARERHEGWSTGFQNEVQRFPETGLAIIMLTNRAAPPVQPIVETIVEVVDP